MLVAFAVSTIPDGELPHPDDIFIHDVRRPDVLETTGMHTLEELCVEGCRRQDSSSVASCCLQVPAAGLSPAATQSGVSTAAGSRVGVIPGGSDTGVCTERNASSAVTRPSHPRESRVTADCVSMLRAVAVIAADVVSGGCPGLSVRDTPEVCRHCNLDVCHHLGEKQPLAGGLPTPATQLADRHLGRQQAAGSLHSQLVAGEDSKQLVANEDSSQLVANEDSKQLVANEDSKQLVANEDSNQLVANEDSNQLVANEDSKQLVANEDSKQLVANEDSKQLVANEDSNQLVANEDSKLIGSSNSAARSTHHRNIPLHYLDNMDLASGKEYRARALSTRHTACKAARRKATASGCGSIDAYMTPGPTRFVLHEQRPTESHAESETEESNLEVMKEQSGYDNAHSDSSITGVGCNDPSVTATICSDRSINGTVCGDTCAAGTVCNTICATDTICDDTSITGTVCDDTWAAGAIYVTGTDCDDTSITDTVCDDTSITGTVCDDSSITGSVSDDSDITDAVCDETIITGTVCDDASITDAGCDGTGIAGTVYDYTCITGTICDDPSITGTVCDDPSITGTVCDDSSVTGAVCDDSSVTGTVCDATSPPGAAPCVRLSASRRPHYKREKNRARVTCEACGKVYSGRAQLALHARLMHTQLVRAQCATCGISVKSEWHLRAHERRVHSGGGAAAGQASAALHLCHLCPARLKQRAYLTAHIKYVHGTAAVRCEYCGQTCSCARYLAQHVQHVHAAPRYACATCARPFSTDANRQRHERLVHAAGLAGAARKEHACTVCAKRFTLAANLKHHVRTVHLRQFRYTCPVCDAGFSRQRELLQHEETHAAELVPRDGYVASVVFPSAPADVARRRGQTRPVGSATDARRIVATPEMIEIFNVANTTEEC